MSNFAYQEDICYEMLDGELFAMSPSASTNHQTVVKNILGIFDKYLKGKPCMVFGDLDVILTENDHPIPDVVVVCNHDIIKPDAIYGPPDLIVEVLSPSTASKDKNYKKTLYGKCGVREYWIVDTSNRIIDVHHLQDGKLELVQVYAIIPDRFIERMSDEEKKARLIYDFKTSLFDDLVINIEDVFAEMI